jgi:hypothetical protein
VFEAKPIFPIHARGQGSAFVRAAIVEPDIVSSGNPATGEDHRVAHNIQAGQMCPLESHHRAAELGSKGCHDNQDLHGKIIQEEAKPP